MCYIKSDELMAQTERKLEALLEELGMPDRFIGNYIPMYVAWAYKEALTDPCCHDIIVTLQDHIEELQCTPPESSSA